MAKTVEQSQRALDETKAHNEKRMNSIRSEIDERVKAGFQHADLDAKLSEARTQAEAGEILLTRNLKATQEREEKEQAEQAERQNAKRAAIEEKRKRAARLSWLANGGDPAEFDTAWKTSIREALLNAAVVADAGKQTNRPVQSL